MKLIGGEPEVCPPGYRRYLTNSGRASLRFIVEAGNLSGKRILLPNYLCGVILDVIEQYDMRYELYDIQSDLSVDIASLGKEFDVIYIINYFGMNLGEKIIPDIPEEKSVILDDVFLPIPTVIDRKGEWYSFNSFRKISQLADGSIIFTNTDLDERKIEYCTLTQFSEKKYMAKHQKYMYLVKGDGTEEQYLELFRGGEEELELQEEIKGMSTDSQIEMAKFFMNMEKEKKTRKDNYNIVVERMKENAIEIETSFYSFAPIMLKQRDKTRKELAEKRIYLPVHWPQIPGKVNRIGDKILSLPLDSRYTEQDMNRICDAIVENR